MILFSGETVVDSASHRINGIGDSDTLQRAEFFQCKCFYRFFHGGPTFHLFITPHLAESMPNPEIPILPCRYHIGLS